MVAALSMIAGIAAAWFGYAAVRGRALRGSKKVISAGRQDSGPYDAFISYAEADEDRAEWLADGLRARGLRVWLAKWTGVGLIEYAEKEAALSASTNGVLLFSRTTMTAPDIQADYAAVLQRVHTTGRRFVPVLVEPVDLPPFARIRRPLDLSNGADPDAALDILAAALRS